LTTVRCRETHDGTARRTNFEKLRNRITLYIFIQSSGNGIPPSGLLESVGTSTDGCIIVLGKTYLTKQASLLLEFARTTSDSDLSAKLVSKAADLKSQADPLPDKDQGSKAPDVTPGQAGS
jgi:hypothetical protein